MIKKLQQLKAKKGFTLVELIVVIAIIGVLAAILVPTMMGFVTSSRVTSANSTAASFEDQIEQFLTDCDTKGYGMRSGNESTAQITIEIDDTGWKTAISATDAKNFKSVNKIDWSTAGSKMNGGADHTAIKNDKIPQNLLSIKLRELFPDIQQGVVIAWVKAGNVEALVYTADVSTLGSDGATKVIGNVASAKYDKGVLSGTDVNWATKTAKWDEKTAGISNTGLTVGTAPALALGSTT